MIVKSPIRPFYKKIINAIHSHPDAFYFRDGQIFAHFAMSKNFSISRTLKQTSCRK